MKKNIDLSLYLVTDSELMSTPTLDEAVEQAIIGGCTVVQLREKTASSREFYNTALSVKKITDKYNVPLIINDRLDIAMAIDADGLHLGQSDLPISIARRIFGDDKIIGISASTLSEAKQAQAEGADYLGVGAMYKTGTKTDAADVTMDELKRIRAAVNIPIVVIGGINKTTLPAFYGTNIDGISVVSAIIAQPNITSAAAELKLMVKNLR